MNNKYLALTALALIFTLSGCAEYHRRVLEDTPEKGPQFTKSLAKEYKALGITEEDEMFDQWSANYYFRKAICAKGGTCVAPTHLDNWGLPKKKIPELASARARLVRALQSGADNRAPHLTARAQASFDCWVEQQAEEWELNDIATCRFGFYRAMAEVEFLLKGGVQNVLPHHSILFCFNSSKLEPKSIEILHAIAKEDKSRHIILIGHTDPVGEKSHNQRLAQARAFAVKKELVRNGISPHLITVKKGGPLPGPKVNAHDRRVDIVFLGR